MSKSIKYEPTGFALDIFKNRYTFTEDETWGEACKRVANQMAMAESPEKVSKYSSKFEEVLSQNLFVPGGRIWYNSGRPNPQLLNCFVLSSDLDSKEGWGNISKEMIITSMTGGGCGIDFSDVRPEGAEIKGQRGTSPGSVSLMELINGNGSPVRSGGARRVALMFSLNLHHPDINTFLDAKLTKGKLQLANVSIRSKYTNDFIKLVKEDGELELSWKGRYKKKVKARDLWNKIVKNAYESAEPGFLNWELVESESPISYIEPLVSTNPCFAPETLITTKNGLYPIEDLVGKEVEILSNGQWVSVNNFRITDKNQKILKITMQDGSELRVTPNHKMILQDGTRLEAKDLSVNSNLLISEYESHGTINEEGAYIKGFLCGDGTTTRNNRPLLYLYPPKYVCRNRLVESAMEIKNEEVNTNCLTELSFTDQESKGKNRQSMQGLTPKKHQLYNWASINKKRLPKESFSWNLKSKTEFLAGLFDADGTAADTKNGFLYQLSSVEEDFLLDIQTLLKTIKVNSKISLMRKGGRKDFNDGYGEYDTKPCYRLTISQSSSIIFSKQVNFSRLISFKDKQTKYSIKAKRNRIISIEDDGIEELVYCCTIPETHSLTLGIGIEVGQCGEIALSSHDCCCLGHLVLPRYIEDGEVNWHLLAQTAKTGIRFLDNVLTVNHYPLSEMKDKSQKLRRIGLGTTGLADMLALLGIEYGSADSLKFIDKLYKFISKASYEASVMLAIEKGPFPEFKAKEHVKTGFVKRLPKKIKAMIEEHGLRNCAMLTQAPTGTVSIISGNCSSGIEPMFAPAYERRYWDKEERKTELVFHPLFKQFMDESKDVSHFKGSRELTVRQHMEVQAAIQKHLDNAVSKTINMPEDYPIEEMSKLWLEFLPKLKGTTFYRENSRGYIDEDGVLHEPPLVALSLEDAMNKYNKDVKTGKDDDDCPNGTCEI